MQKSTDLKQVGSIKTLKSDVGSLLVRLKKGDKVQIIGIGDRGYDLKGVTSDGKVIACGWDLFEEE